VALGLTAVKQTEMETSLVERLMTAHLNILRILQVETLVLVAKVKALQTVTDIATQLVHCLSLVHRLQTCHRTTPLRTL
jgi:hypothetical protein